MNIGAGWCHEKKPHNTPIPFAELRVTGLWLRILAGGWNDHREKLERQVGR
jgi:hypothetical protein